MRALVILMFLSAGVQAQTEDGFKTLHQWQFGVGPAFAGGVNTPYMITGWRFGYGVQFHPRYDIQVVADWIFSSVNTDMHFISTSIVSNYYFTDEVTTPLASIDVGYGSVHSHRPCDGATCESPADDASGLVIGGGFGLKTLRGSGFNLGILAHADVLCSTTTHGTPVKYAIQGLVYF